MAKKTDGSSKGGIRRPRGPKGKWTATLILKDQPAQRCPACTVSQDKPRPKAVWWLSDGRQDACPNCGGALRDTKERRQEYLGSFDTSDEAELARADAMSDQGKGRHTPSNKVTLQAYLEERWLPALRGNMELGELRPSTFASYKSHVEHHFKGSALGKTRLQDLTTQNIRAYYGTLRTSGRADGAKDEEGSIKPLSTTTIRRINATLQRALRDAVDEGLLPVNPAVGVFRNKGVAQTRGKIREHWDAAELAKFLALESVRQDRLSALWLLYATTGARRGELLALRPTDVDLEDGKLSIHRTLLEVGGEVVEGEPKTASGRRTISLDPVTKAALKRHLTQRKAERLAAGPKWRDSGYIFTDERGQRLLPGAVGRRFSELVTASELKPISLHGLRHSWATIALNELRLPLSQVSARLGHADESVTLRVYSHALEREDEQAAVDVASRVVPAGF